MSKSAHIVSYIREKVRDEFRMKYALREIERKALISEVGVHGLVLFEYYLRMASVEGMELTDEDASEYFGWSIHTTGRWRRELIKNGWFHSDNARLNNGEKVIVYYLGKSEVKRTVTRSSK